VQDMKRMLAEAALQKSYAGFVLAPSDA
jgi:hypothetical protein